MIRITKPKKPPQVLRIKGKNKRAAHIRAYNKTPADYRTGAKSFKFDSKIYGHKTVKTALKKAQKNKCVFCESHVSSVAYGDVEHFRPKGGVRQNEADDLQKPGYYWLAYEWDNFFFSCQICNQRHKKNLFPLVETASRARTHNDDVSAEESLFIDPGKEDPQDFISFRKEIPFAVRGNRRGKLTITALGLDREELNEVRYDRYHILKSLHDLIALWAAPDTSENVRLKIAPLVAGARRNLERAVSSRGIYASMARANFPLEDND